MDAKTMDTSGSFTPPVLLLLRRPLVAVSACLSLLLWEAELAAAESSESTTTAFQTRDFIFTVTLTDLQRSSRALYSAHLGDTFYILLSVVAQPLSLQLMIVSIPLQSPGIASLSEWSCANPSDSNFFQMDPNSSVTCALHIYQRNSVSKEQRFTVSPTYEVVVLIPTAFHTCRCQIRTLDKKHFQGGLLQFFLNIVFLLPFIK